MNTPSQIRSTVPEFIWPALPPPAVQPHLALLYQFERSQWWPAEFVLEKQFQQLSALIDHSLATVPFFREQLGVTSLRSGMALTPEHWREIPILTRDCVQQAGIELHSTALPTGHGPTGMVSSSGSTGRPIKAVLSRLSQLFWEAITLREHIWHRRDTSGKLASIRLFPAGTAAYPDGIVDTSWGGAVAAVFHTGPVAGLTLDSTIDQQVDWLVRHNPDYLLTYPTILLELANYCRKNSVKFPQLRQARTISEVLTTEIRSAVRGAWGIDIADAYSAVEVGYMALQCPDYECLHVQSENVYLEILRNDGTPCESGEVGRVVVTGLHNFAMPLIRYEIGDYAEVGPACPCGRGLPVINRVLGRVRNMLRLPDGREVWPVIGANSYVEIPAIRQYQIAQKSYDLLQMRLVTDRPLTTDEESRLREIVQERLGHRYEITLIYQDNIPRSAGGKFEDFKCEMED